jgi:nucleotide-binding universal stress UspA family protein
VVHVLPEMNVADPGVIWLTIDNESRCLHSTQALDERLSGPKYDGIQMHIEIGDPGLRVTDYAQEIGADLIVIPSHGRTGLRRLLIGSVAERIVRLAHCPVLVLRK